MVDISVNLATHNRASYLDSCLASLCTQSVDPNRYEVCVVANACTDATPEVVTHYIERYPRHRLFMVSDPIPGLAHARNCGIRSTTGALIANIDDDATASENWLETFLTRFAELTDDVAAVGGEINPLWQAPPPAWLEPHMKGTLSAASNMGAMARFIEPHEGLFEGNSCYRRAALASINFYPSQLGRVGTTLLSGEGAINALLRARGWRLFFEPLAIINHTIHADRLTPMWFRRRYFWQGISDYAAHLYYVAHGLNTVESMNLDLPLKKSDWSFIGSDTAEDLSQNIRYFQNLGFVLAMTGLISVDDD